MYNFHSGLREKRYNYTEIQENDTKIMKGLDRLSPFLILWLRFGRTIVLLWRTIWFLIF